MKKLFVKNRTHSGLKNLANKAFKAVPIVAAVGATQKRLKARKAVKKAIAAVPTAAAQLAQTEAAQKEQRAYLEKRDISVTGDPQADALLVAGAVREEMEQKAREVVAENPEILDEEEVNDPDLLADEMLEQFEQVNDQEEADNYQDCDAFTLSPTTYAAVDEYVGEIMDLNDSFDNFDDENADYFLMDAIDLGIRVAKNPKVQQAAKQVGKKTIGKLKERREKKKGKASPVLDAIAPSQPREAAEIPEIGRVQTPWGNVSWGATNNRALMGYIAIAAVAIIAVVYFSRKK